MKDLMKHMKVVGNSIVAESNMSLYIPKRYEDKNFFSMENTIHTLAVFEIVVGKETFGFQLFTFIEMDFDDVRSETIDGVDYYHVSLIKGNKFIIDTEVLKSPSLPYKIFKEFIDLGKLPKFISYDDSAVLFDSTGEVCDFYIRVSHAVFELVYAHLFRDSGDLSVKYRYTDMRKPPVFIGLTDIAYGTDSTTTKITGSYFTDGINAAISHQAEQQFELEDLLRG